MDISSKITFNKNTLLIPNGGFLRFPPQYNWSIVESGVKENNQPAVTHWQTLSHNVVSSTYRLSAGFELTTLMAIGTDCMGSCKSNYHTVTTTTVIWTTILGSPRTPSHLCVDRVEKNGNQY